MRGKGWVSRKGRLLGKDCNPLSVSLKNYCDSVQKYTSLTVIKQLEDRVYGVSFEDRVY